MPSTHPWWKRSGHDLVAPAIGFFDPGSVLLNPLLKVLLAIKVFGPKARTAAGVSDPLTGMRDSSVTGCAFRLRKRAQGAVYGLVRSGNLR